MMTNLAAAASQPSITMWQSAAVPSLTCSAQILADASGRAVKRLATVEASSLGAAVAAAKGAGWFTSIPQAAAAMAGKPVKTFRPSVKSQRRYKELLAIYTDLYPAIRDWNARLNTFAGRDRA